MNNHLRPPQETPLWPYFTKTLILQGFQPLKIQLLTLFALFSLYFRTSIIIPYSKKTQKPLYYLRFRALLFFPIKTDNPPILYIENRDLLSLFIIKRLGKSCFFEEKCFQLSVCKKRKTGLMNQPPTLLI